MGSKTKREDGVTWNTMEVVLDKSCRKTGHSRVIWLVSYAVFVKVLDVVLQAKAS